MTKILQHHIDASTTECDHTSSEQLFSMQIEDLSEHPPSMRLERGINALLQSLIGVIDKGNTMNQDNKELSACCLKYEHDLEEQQQRLLKVQVECGNLTN